MFILNTFMMTFNIKYFRYHKTLSSLVSSSSFILGILILFKLNYSKISSNHLSAADATTDYSFVYGIYATGANNDISDNTIVDCTNEGSIGIYNGSASSRTKIIGNTIIANGTNQTIPATTSNYGLYIITNSYFTEVYNNTIITIT